MIKGLYHGIGKSATIVNNVYSGGAEAYSIKFRTLDAFYTLLRDILKDADKHKGVYAIPQRILQGFFDYLIITKQLEDWGFRPDEYRGYWRRTPTNVAAIPYEIVSGRYNRDKVLIVNNTIDMGVYDNLYVVRNLYKEVLTVTDSLIEAERYMTP